MHCLWSCQASSTQLRFSHDYKHKYVLSVRLPGFQHTIRFSHDYKHKYELSVRLPGFQHAIRFSHDYKHNYALSVRLPGFQHTIWFSHDYKHKYALSVRLPGFQHAIRFSHDYKHKYTVTGTCWWTMREKREEWSEKETDRPTWERKQETRETETTWTMQRKRYGKIKQINTVSALHRTSWSFVKSSPLREWIFPSTWRSRRSYDVCHVSRSLGNAGPLCQMVCKHHQSHRTGSITDITKMYLVVSHKFKLQLLKFWTSKTSAQKYLKTWDCTNHPIEPLSRSIKCQPRRNSNFMQKWPEHTDTHLLVLAGS